MTTREIVLRPFTADEKETFSGENGYEEMHVCEFCKQPLEDQELLSWDMCCIEFELSVQIVELQIALEWFANQGVKEYPPIHVRAALDQSRP
jgi:hypothetical protein